MNWKTVELVKNYWIILDKNYNEYHDYNGDNRMFYTKEEADQFIEWIGVAE